MANGLSPNMKIYIKWSEEIVGQVALKRGGYGLEERTRISGEAPGLEETRERTHACMDVQEPSWWSGWHKEARPAGAQELSSVTQRSHCRF